MIINSITDIVKAKGLQHEDQLHRFVFKYTGCGAWISWDDKSVTIGSIVEGSDAEFSESFSFPVDSDVLDNWMVELDALCDEAWHEANETEDDEDYHHECEPTRSDWDTDEDYSWQLLD